MSQTDMNVANASGAVVRADINDHLTALSENNSGASAPGTTFANQWWFDTSTNTMKQRNNANTAWVSVALKDGSGWRTVFNNVALTILSQAEAEAGTETAVRFFTAERVAQAIAALRDGVLQDVQVYTSNDTWTKPTGLTRALVRVIGGGGGAGGANGTGSTSSGGGGGGGSEKLIAAASLGATEVVTVGAGAVAGGSGGGNGQAGGTSSFGAHLSATGGAAGQGATGGSLAIAVAGGVGSGGAVSWNGGSSSFGDTGGYGGSGGASALGGGGVGKLDATGGAGAAYGGGGGGSRANASNQAGGSGAGGIVIVHEYF